MKKCLMKLNVKAKSFNIDNCDDYDDKYLKIKINSDDDLPLTLKFTFGKTLICCSK